MIRIPKPIYEAIINHARREAPLECCGILAGKNGIVQKAFEVKNAEQSSFRYSMAPPEQLRVFDEMEREQMEMLAIYHSHTHTDPYPSETDIQLAFYPDVVTVIISLKEESPEVKAFRIVEKSIQPEEIEMV